jgi:ABC-type transport system involved in multi-copper enzyme maturation permease subunit
VIWLSWRQLRAQAAAASAAVLAVAVVAALTGPRLADLARTSVSVFDRLTATDTTLFYAGIVLMALAPALLGAFLGAPLVARELETGTYRLAWSQSATRRRWLASKLALTVAAAALAAGAASLAVTWWSAPLDGAVSQTRGGLPDHLTPITFAMRGVVPVSYAAFAVVLGATAGAVLRRTLPAMAVTLALYVGVQIVVPIWVRPYLVPPVSSTVSFSGSTLDGISLDGRGHISVSVHTADRGDWILVNETVGPDGRAAQPPQWFAECLPGPSAPASGTQQAAAGSIDECLTRLTRAGYRQRVVYQPASRFWPLQWAETGLYVAASAALAVGCFWWVRRRLT